MVSWALWHSYYQQLQEAEVPQRVLGSGPARATEYVQGQPEPSETFSQKGPGL